MIDPIKTGKYIAQLRKEQDMTQLSLAAEMKVTHQAVSKWETGNALPDIEMLLLLSRLFDISIESLLAGEKTDTMNINEYDEDIPEDKLIYSETMAELIKTQSNIPMLLEASEEMLGKDIADCVQTLSIQDEITFHKLSVYMSSSNLAQVIKTFRNISLLKLVHEKMDRGDIKDCIQTLNITNSDDIRIMLKQ